MRIAMVVHGRFHAFDLARALIARGHDVQVFTNYPIWAARKFGLPDERIQSFWPHGVATRIIDRFNSPRLADRASPALHAAFGKWAAERVNREKWDIVHAFSGVAEDILRTRTGNSLRTMVRGSCHIRVQDQILAEEALRTGVPLGRPIEWIMQREEREYQLCDRIMVLSTFAYNSFVAQGFPPSKLFKVALGVDTKGFRPTPEIVEERCRRIAAGEPLRLLLTGNLNFRKGLYDFAEIVRRLPADRFKIRAVGTVSEESRSFVEPLEPRVEFVSRQPQAELPRWYADSDIFLFPTLEDGYAAVLSQAYASALPVIATTNCAAPDLIADGQTGWTLPIRDVDAFVERLLWCDDHREELIAMVRRIYREFHPRDWDDMAADFERMLLALGGASRVG